MSHSYDGSGYPLSMQQCIDAINALKELYPNAKRRDFTPGTRGLESFEEAVVHVGFMEHVIDGQEMELLYEFLETGKTYWMSQPLGAGIIIKR